MAERGAGLGLSGGKRALDRSGALVKERGELGRFRSWEEVDAVSGVGPAKLDILKRSAELR